MYWLAIALCAPALYAVSNILDNKLSNRLFQNTWSFIFYGACFQALFLPVLWVMDPPAWPAASLWPWIAVIAVTQTLYLYPYFKALQHDDTSTVTSLFSLGKLCVPLLAFFLVGEVLAVHHYIGFLVIIFASTLLTLQPGKLRFNRSLWYMLISSLILSVDVVIYKYIFIQVSWGTGFFWTILCAWILSLGLLLLPRIRHHIIHQWRGIRSFWKLLLVEEIFTFGGAVTATYAVSLVPVTVAKSIDTIQPFFVVLYTIILQRFVPHFEVETFTRQSFIRKVILFIVMLAGVVLVALPDLPF